MTKLVLYLLFISLLLISCSGDIASVTPINNLIENNEAGQIQPTIIAQIPTPQPDKGVITGKLIIAGTNEPLISRIYLGDIVPLTPGPDFMITMGVARSQHTRSDSNGTFVFDKVEPGEYPVIIFSSVQSYIIPNDSGTDALIINVKPGEMIDLGELEVFWDD